MPDNPCKDCMCGNDGRPTGECMERMCDPIQCPQGLWAKYIDGTCCGFECVDRREFVSSYRSGTVNANTVNSKFHLIRSFFEYLARFLSFHV